MRIEVVGRGLPGTQFGGLGGVRVGVQRGRDVVDSVAGDAEEVRFVLPANLVNGELGPDLRGPFVHGRRGERFLYLVWTYAGPDGAPVLFRRAKLQLAPVLELGVTGDALVRGSLELIDRRGGPVCASVWPPAISWEIVEP